jgi:hypothetical protein
VPTPVEIPASLCLLAGLLPSKNTCGKNPAILPIGIGWDLAYNLTMAQTTLVTWYDGLRDGKVHEVTEDLFYQALNVMPPIEANGCFAMGEPVSSDKHGYPTYYWFMSAKGKYYGFYGIKAHAIMELREVRTPAPTLMENYRDYNKGLGSMGGPL